LKIFQQEKTSPLTKLNLYYETQKYKKIENFDKKKENGKNSFTEKI